MVILGILCVCYPRKKKRRHNEYDSEDYRVPPPQPLHAPAGPKAQQVPQNACPPAEHYQVPKPSPLPAAPQHPGRSLSPQPPPPSPGISLGFSYNELAMATDDFSDSNILGKGSFGCVHKGVLPNGKEVVVKSLKAGARQRKYEKRDILMEIDIFTRVHHRNLVSLVGYCITESQWLLVYEFVPNGTMEFHLHAKGQPTMDWPTRLRIALGTAKALAFLHEDCHPKIIHRNIKAANILLDYKFEAKIRDSGITKFSYDENPRLLTRVIGTFGYLAPEYARSGKVTDKVDVYSYGIILLELITGRRPLDSPNYYMYDCLVDWARPLLTRALEENKFDSLVDSRLQNNFNPNEMACMVACAAACVRHSAQRRPQMSQVARALEGEMSVSDPKSQ